MGLSLSSIESCREIGAVVIVTAEIAVSNTICTATAQDGTVVYSDNESVNKWTFTGLDYNTLYTVDCDASSGTITTGPSEDSCCCHCDSFKIDGPIVARLKSTCDRTGIYQGQASITGLTASTLYTVTATCDPNDPECEVCDVIGQFMSDADGNFDGQLRLTVDGKPSFVTLGLNGNCDPSYVSGVRPDPAGCGPSSKSSGSKSQGSKGSKGSKGDSEPEALLNNEGPETDNFRAGEVTSVTKTESSFSLAAMGGLSAGVAAVTFLGTYFSMRRKNPERTHLII